MLCRGMTKGVFKQSLVGILILAGTSSSDAQPTLKEFDTASRFDQALAAVDAIKSRKKLQCVLTTASWALCECLSQKLPVDTYPRSYPAMAKKEAEYERLSDADKSIVRQCIADAR